MRRDFTPIQPDLQYLENAALPWEAVKENGHWIIIHDFPIPAGYNHSTTSIAIRIETGYPEAQLDMAYFNPPLILTSGVVPKQTGEVQNIAGRAWQRWSRHYTPANPWCPGEHNLSTHLAAVNSWLEREVGK